jgi:hypothetical protein
MAVPAPRHAPATTPGPASPRSRPFRRPRCAAPSPRSNGRPLRPRRQRAATASCRLLVAATRASSRRRSGHVQHPRSRAGESGNSRIRDRKHYYASQQMAAIPSSPNMSCLLAIWASSLLCVASRPARGGGFLSRPTVVRTLTRTTHWPPGANRGANALDDSATTAGPDQRTLRTKWHTSPGSFRGATCCHQNDAQVLSELRPEPRPGQARTCTGRIRAIAARRVDAFRIPCAVACGCLNLR